ncbi:hypothetical protein V8G54_010314 [Vigna mungo]|uniref:Uncharacterized protein n=1 Tax=Vigna mungo TaxID=3915 RepID=A0AAQ3NYV4_VIGMU
MADTWYPDLVRVFYCNLKISDGTLYSIVKEVDIKLTEVVWTDITGLKLGGERCYRGTNGFDKFSMYQDNYSSYKTGGMRKDDRLAVFTISWILMPRGSNHAQATIEDLFLLKALKENIQVDCLVAILDNMLKVTRLELAKLPYCVFISKILIHFGVDYIGESSESYNKTSMISQSALHMMQMQYTPEGWVFKSEVVDVEGETEQSSTIPYRARSEFKRTMLRETRNDVLELKERMSFQDQWMDGENEEVSNEEESTPDVSVGMSEDKSDEEVIADESNGLLKGLRTIGEGILVVGLYCYMPIF